MFQPAIAEYEEALELGAPRSMTTALLANTLGLVGLVGVFYLTGWAADHILMAGRGLAPVAGVGRLGLGAAVWIALLFLMAAVGLLNPPMLGLMLLLTLAGLAAVRLVVA